MNELRDLIRNAVQLQKITDTAVEKVLDELERICPSKRIYTKAEAAALLFIYDGIDRSDKKITLDQLIEKIGEMCANYHKKQED